MPASDHGCGYQREHNESPNDKHAAPLFGHPGKKARTAAFGQPDAVGFTAE
jgi:hypothetical protein